jgi:beta-fructofuranosidase
MPIHLKANASEKHFQFLTEKLEHLKIKTHIKATSSTQFGFEFGACGTRNVVFTIVLDLAKIN